MKSRALLVFSCSDLETRDGLASVLTPDNEGGPRGLGISMESKGNRLTIQVEAETPETAMSTSLAFLRDVALFQEVWLLSRAKRG
jgi:hypothetical protein